MKKFFLTFLLFPHSCLAMNFCASQNGQISFQDKPCEQAKSSKPKLIGSNQKSSKAAIDTVKNFFEALSKKDVDSAILFLTNDFLITTVRPHNKIETDNFPSYSAELRKAIDGSISYDGRTNCKVKSTQNDAYDLTCHSKSFFVLPFKKTLQAEAQEEYRIVTDNGFLKIAKVISIETEPKWGEIP